MAEHYRLTKIEKHITEYIIDLYNDFPNGHEIEEVFNVLDTASDNDSIVIKIGDNEGGNIETGLKLINSVKLTRAPVRVIVDSVCHSMASIFVCAMINAGLEVMFMPNIYLMFHDYSCEESGKGSELVASVTSGRDWIKEVYSTHCYPFLSKAEINKIMQGKDIYIQYDEANKRLSRFTNG